MRFPPTPSLATASTRLLASVINVVVHVDGLSINRHARPCLVVLTGLSQMLPEKLDLAIRQSCLNLCQPGVRDLRLEEAEHCQTCQFLQMI